MIVREAEVKAPAAMMTEVEEHMNTLNLGHMHRRHEKKCSTSICKDKLKNVGHDLN